MTEQIASALSLPDKLPQPACSGLDFPVVGLGASAGGVDALLKLLDGLPAAPGMAFVVILHLSPDHESRAADILQKASRMPVREVESALAIEPNAVYVIPPRRGLAMMDGRLSLTDLVKDRGRQVVIDLFFRTLAQAHRDRAIAVVLSGFGADGSVGIADVKEWGGVVIAQSPSDAQYHGMPSSAIATGRVDMILPAAEIGQKLLDLWRNAQAIELPDGRKIGLRTLAPSSPEQAEHAERALRSIMDSLHARTGHDFRHYKRATVLRRIERRLQVNGVRDLNSYDQFLTGHPEETPLLLNDMLIGVTNFFRDRGAFESVERSVIPSLFNEGIRDEQLRVWVAGCSTGEEAYSLAMLMQQENAVSAYPRMLQLFASDIDEPAIAKAREGSYPAAVVTDIPPSLLRKYMILDDSRYRVNKALRSHVLFARHNILRDPPFSRLDLVSCRNLLIYLNRDVQREILEMFHFALRPGGYLFLGSAETADVASGLYSPVDKRHRIYRAIAAPLAVRKLPRFPLGNAENRPAVSEISQAGQLASVGSPGGAGNAGNGINGSKGSNGSRGDGGNAGNAGSAGGSQSVANGAHFGTPGHAGHAVSDHAAPGELQREAPLGPSPSMPVATAAGEALILKMEAELQRKDEQLRRLNIQYESAVEELQSSNEELQAINEELRSATEELETSKEELRSAHEEVSSDNLELQARIKQAAQTHDDLQNLIAASQIATVFVDRDMRIKRFTPAATEVINIIPADVGRSLLDITHKLQYDSMTDDAMATFSSLRVVEHEVPGSGDRWFLVRMLPYRTAEDRIDGAVLTFVDITSRRSAERRVDIDRERMQLIADSMPDFAILTLDEAGKVTSWSAGAERLFGFKEAEMLGQSADVIFTPEDRAAGVPQTEMRTAQQKGRALDERWHLRKDGSRIFVSGIMAPMGLGRLKGYAKIARDMTARQHEDTSRSLALTSAVSAAAHAHELSQQKDEFLAVMSHELKHPLNLIQLNAQLLNALPEVQQHPSVLKIAKTIQQTVRSQARIIDDLLDVSRTRAGKLVLNVVPVYLAEALRDSMAWATSQAAAKDITLYANLSEEPLLVRVDPVRFEQIALNLLSNAIKFTRHGGEIGVRRYRQDDEAVLEVADNGRGISAPFLAQVFELFKQAEPQPSREQGGLGIGLALVRDLVELQGGSVAAASPGPGRGATFTVRFPISQRTDFGALDMRRTESALAGLRILCVEDTPDALQTFSLLLEMEKAEVTGAGSGQEALDIAANQSFDLVISDIGMPQMDGYELIGRLKRMPNAAATPAIALTGYGRPKDVELAMQAGFDGHLNKPVNLEELQQLAARLVKKRSA